MVNNINILDGGTIEEEISEMKKFLGISENQDFKDIVIEDDKEMDNNKKQKKGRGGYAK